MSTATGRAAEDFVAAKLKKRGLTILETNWRTRTCEIDIVAKSKNAVYFVEVKYRSSSEHGRGLEYITPKKIKQMDFAARSWIAVNDWQGDYHLSAAEVCTNKKGELTLTDFVVDVA